MGVRGWSGSAAVMVVLLHAAPAIAESPALAARVDYRAPVSACPDARSFFALLARSSEVTVTPDAETEVVVAITAEGGRFRGTVTISGDTSGAREVSAPRCHDVARGLAVFTAIALDAYFTRSEPASDDAAIPREPTPPLRPAIERVPVRARARPAERLPAPPAPPRAAWSLDANLSSMLGPGRALSALGATVELSPLHRAFGALRLGARLAFDLPRSYGGGTLTYQAFWLQAEGCPAGATVHGVLVSACVLGELGGQRASLAGVSQGKTRLEPWAALGVGAHVRAALGDGWHLDLGAAVVRPLVTVDFSTLRGQAFSTPALAPIFELGLGYAFR